MKSKNKEERVQWQVTEFNFYYNVGMIRKECPICKKVSEKVYIEDKDMKKASRLRYTDEEYKYCPYCGSRLYE